MKAPLAADGLAALVPVGAAVHLVDDPGPTRAYVFVLVPGFTFLAFAAAVEPLRIANQLSQRPLYSWELQSEDGAAVASSSAIPVGVNRALAPRNKDTRLFVCAGNPASEAAARAVVAAVQRHHRFGGMVGGICTGAIALAEAGLLSERRFTLHWENQIAFAETFPDLTPTGSRFEIDGRIVTCGGGAAATDMMLRFIDADHGPAFAATVSDMCLRTVLPGVTAEQRSSTSAFLTSRNPALIASINMMNDHLSDLVSMADLAAAAGCSRRHLERLFKDATGKTPARYYRDLRLDRGRNLFATTDMSVAEISVACGFDSRPHFTRCFKDRFGATPAKLRSRA